MMGHQSQQNFNSGMERDRDEEDRDERDSRERRRMRGSRERSRSFDYRVSSLIFNHVNS